MAIERAGFPEEYGVQDGDSPSTSVCIFAPLIAQRPCFAAPHIFLRLRGRETAKLPGQANEHKNSM